MKNLNRNLILSILIILPISFLFSSCSSFLYSSKRSKNNSFIVESNIKDFAVKFPLAEGSRDSYYSHGFATPDNKIQIELPKLKKKYLTINVEKQNYESQSFKIRKTVRGGAILMDVGLSVWTIGIPMIIDPFRSDFYKISTSSKRMYVKMNYSKEYLDQEYFKIKEGNRIDYFQEYISLYPESKWNKNALAKIDSLKYINATSSQNINELKNFINKNTDSKYKANALIQIDSIELTNAISEFNIERINQFISSNPNSKFIQRAKKAISNIKEIDTAFEDAKSQNALSSYRNFISKYPNSKYQQEAKEAIAGMIETGTLNGKDGAIYTGEFKTKVDGSVIRHGKGILVVPNRGKYDGRWNNDQFTNGIFYDEKGEKVYDGEWKNFEFSGKGILTPKSGELAGYKLAGHFLNNKANGFGTLFKPDSTKEYEGYWKDFQYDGYGTSYLNGKKLYEGEFKSGQTDGKGTVYAQNGQIEGEGQFKNWKLNGYGKRYKNGKLYYEGDLFDNIPNGMGTMYYDNGNKEFEGGFNNGQPNGQGTSYKKNGQKESEGIFVDGKYSPEEKKHPSNNNSSTNNTENTSSTLLDNYYGKSKSTNESNQEGSKFCFNDRYDTGNIFELRLIDGGDAKIVIKSSSGGIIRTGEGRWEGRNDGPGGNAPQIILRLSTGVLRFTAIVGGYPSSITMLIDSKDNQWSKCL